MIDFKKEGPQFTGSKMWPDLAKWVWKTRLPWLVERLNLSAGDILPEVDYKQNNVFVLRPGTGKGVVLVPAALRDYRQIYVLEPSVVIAHKLKESLDVLYHEQVGGVHTAQMFEDDLIDVVTTGILKRLIRDKESPFWDDDAVLFVDELQRIIGQDLVMEFLIGYSLLHGKPTQFMSATVDPSNLKDVYNAAIHEDTRPRSLPKITQVLDKEIDVFLSESVQQWCEDKKVSLAFCPTRARVIEIAQHIRKLGGDKIGVVTVTGTDMVEKKEAEIEYWMEQGVALAIVATPGVMDSGITIPKLQIVLIEDALIQVSINRWGYLEMIRTTNPNMLLWQMIYRVGRVEGVESEVFLFTPKDRSKDLDINTVQFEKITGVKPWKPIEMLMLEAVELDVPFDHIDDYMVSDFPHDREQVTIDRLVKDGAIVVDEATQTDCALTDYGKQILDLPFEEYDLCKVIADAPEHLQKFVALAMSFSGSLYQYRDFEETLEVKEDSLSEVITKMNIGLEYWNSGHDEEQMAIAQGKGLSFRRLEQVETQFMLALQVLDIEPDYIDPEELDWLRDELIRYFVRCGLYEVFLLQKGKRGFALRRKDPDGKWRLYFPNKSCGVKLESASLHGFVGITAKATWARAYSGQPIAHLNDISVIPQDILKGIIDEYAANEGWEKMSFSKGVNPKGKPVMEAKIDGVTYVEDDYDEIRPSEGVDYWVKVTDSPIARNVFVANLKFPVI